MEKKSVKIVTIGGGSSYTPELMEGFIKRYDELPIREIWLVDIEDGKENLKSLERWLNVCGMHLLMMSKYIDFGS